MGNSAQLFGAMLAEIRAFWKVLTKQTIGIFVAATLPGTLRVTEVDIETGIDPQLRMLRHPDALIPGK